VQAAPPATVAADGLRLRLTLRVKKAFAGTRPIAAMAGPWNPAADSRPMRGTGRDGQFSRPRGKFRDIRRDNGHDCSRP
jgi:hypothetical protein